MWRVTLKANTQQQIVLIVLACVVGVLTHLSIHRYGNFLVKQDSALWGVTIGIFLYASQLVLVGRWVKRVGGLTQSTRLLVIGVGFVSLLSALFMGFKEVNRGYPQLSLSMLDDPDEITNQHFTVVSDLNMQRVYTSSGYLGDLKLIPLTDFGHRILLMLSRKLDTRGSKPPVSLGRTFAWSKKALMGKWRVHFAKSIVNSWGYRGPKQFGFSIHLVEQV